MIPGNERAIGRIQNQLSRRGIEVVTEAEHFVHVSGHPARDELTRMYQIIRPKVAIPVHGEARHLIAHICERGIRNFQLRRPEQRRIHRQLWSQILDRRLRRRKLRIREFRSAPLGRRRNRSIAASTAAASLLRAGRQLRDVRRNIQRCGIKRFVFCLC